MPEPPKVAPTVMNLTKEPRTLYQGTRIGEVHTINEVKQFQNLTSSEFCFDDDEDSEDDEWLINMRTTGCIGEVSHLRPVR